MILKFHAKGDLLVTLPGVRPIIGSFPRYVGRQYDATNRQHPASAVPHECDSDSDEGQRLMQLCVRDNALFPADEATAHACGIKFIPLTLDEGEWKPTVIAKVAVAKATSK